MLTNPLHCCIVLPPGAARALLCCSANNAPSSSADVGSADVVRMPAVTSSPSAATAARSALPPASRSARLSCAASTRQAKGLPSTQLALGWGKKALLASQLATHL